jgi:hypothetical protein
LFCKIFCKIGSITHQQSIAVIGSPFIRKMSNISVIDGQTLRYRCPVVQIEPKDPQIKWFKSNKELPLNERHKVYENGTLIIRDMNRELDSGKYLCKAISKSGQQIKQDLYIDVLSESIIFKNIIHINI